MFAADDSEGEDEEVEYRHIPDEEQMPIDAAAPCVAELLHWRTGNESDTTTPGASGA